jgi:SulP family sulfate permease
VSVDRSTDPSGRAVYAVHGALFFASSNELYTQFDYAGDPADVVVDLSGAQIWDASTVAALDAITHKYATRGKRVEIVGLAGHSADRFERHSGQLG